MLRLALAAVVVLLAVGCATTGVHEGAGGPVSSHMSAVTGDPVANAGVEGGSALLSIRDQDAAQGGLSVASGKSAAILKRCGYISGSPPETVMNRVPRPWTSRRTRERSP